jgi:hypothetical protein
MISGVKRMIKEFAEKWFKNKDKLETWFKTTRQEEYSDYEIIVKKVVELIINDSDDDYDNYSLEDLVVIDNGNYQGTQLFITHKNRYSPYIEDYIITHNDYGSCSGCDTLLGISMYDDELPNDNQVEDYMALSLHILQRFCFLGEDDV